MGSANLPARRDPTTLWPLVSLLATSLLLNPALGSSVIVPDEFPTIQQGVDSGADTVWVNSGTYAEDVVANSAVTLLPRNTSTYPGSLALVTINGLTASRNITVRAFRFKGPVVLNPSGSFQESLVRFEACRFDAGMTTTGRGFWSFLAVLGCVFLGDVDVTTYSGFLANSAFVGAHLNIAAEGSAIVSSSVFENSGDYAIREAGEVGSADIVNNTITNAVNGIVIESQGGYVSGNDVSRCTGAGVRTQGTGSAQVHNNRIHDCEGHGVEFAGTLFNMDLVGNVIEDVGGDGIHNSGPPAYFVRGNQIRRAGGRGMFASGVKHGLCGNLVLDSGDDGIEIGYAERVDSNTVGRAGACGLSVEELAPGTPPGISGSLRNNTVFQCSGAGIEIASEDADSILNNISFANVGPGLTWTGTGTPVFGCNDWFANTGGATSGVGPGVSDLAVDPMFCNVSQDDVHLSTASPLLDATGCGQIGALGEGCATSAGVAVGGAPAGFTIAPSPARGTVRFSWDGMGEPKRIEVFDVMGARRFVAELPVGSNGLAWDFKDGAGMPVPPGVYLARLTTAGKSVSGKFIRVR